MTVSNPRLRIGMVAAAVALLGLTAACGAPRPSLDLGLAVAESVAQQPATFATPAPARRAAIADAVVALLDYTSATVPQAYERVSLRDAGGALGALAEVGSPRRGDGLYVVRLGSRSPLVIEAPHPASDQHTELVAAAVFTLSRAEALLVAGTHRDAAPDGSADAAHAASTAFAAVDRRLSVGGTTVVQIHGFATAKHPGYPQVVLSDSTPTPGVWLSVLAHTLERDGFSTCVFDGSVCRDLGATGNVEADQARASGARFVHVELADAIRQSRDARRRVSSALARALLDALVARPS